MSAFFKGFLKFLKKNCQKLLPGAVLEPLILSKDG
jgi:hypothetical protein